MAGNVDPTITPLTPPTQSGVSAEQQYAEQLRTIYNIHQAMLSASSLEDMAFSILRTFRQMFPNYVENLIIYDLTAYTAQFIVRDLHASDEGSYLLEQVELGTFAETNIALETYRNGISHIFPLADISRRTPSIESMLQAGLYHCLCVPVTSHREVYGVLQFAATNAQDFLAEDILIIQNVAESLAVAIRQAHLFEKLQHSHERLRALAQELVLTQETERRRIAHNLHDQVGQNLSALTMSLTAIRSQLSPETSTRVQSLFSFALHAVEETMEQIRNVIADLRPSVLDDYGLVAALRWYTRYMAERTDLDIELHVQDFEPRLALDVETALFRIVQESITNTIKHAHTNNVTISLHVEAYSIRLTVSDNGVGFNHTPLHRQDQHISLGLAGMHERAEAVRGSLMIKSAPGQGTHISIEVPRES